MAVESAQPVTNQIGLTAGEIWQLLATTGGMSLAKIAKQVEAPRDLVMQAIGCSPAKTKFKLLKMGE